MKKRQILILSLLVLAPILALADFGWRASAQEYERVIERFKELNHSRLEEFAAAIARHLEEKERHLLKIAEGFPETAALIRAQADSALDFRFLLLFDTQGELLFPPPDGPKSAGEQAFLERTRPLREEGRFLKMPQREQGPLRAYGWHLWYWGEGLHLMFWHQGSRGRVLVLELDRIRLLSDLVALLPSTAPRSSTGAEESLSLIDARGERIYSWGNWSAEEGSQLSLALKPPLGAWRLIWEGPLPHAQGLPISILINLLAVALALSFLAVYFYRENSRALRRAAQRVSFVNQVSHELKTPLTNIRMYSELLEEEIDEEDRAARYVGIIVQESQRLSRLIANILTFARQQRERLQLRQAPGCVDELVLQILEQHRPGLEAAGVEVRFEGGAAAEVMLDKDLLGQILGNLLSNVEKYAVGEPLLIRSRQKQGESCLWLHDGGPGIPKGQRAEIFKPFRRLSNALTEGRSGTGIGLGIAQDLARLHGGDLILESSSEGSCFLLSLHTPPR